MTRPEAINEMALRILMLFTKMEPYHINGMDDDELAEVVKAAFRIAHAIDDYRKALP